MDIRNSGTGWLVMWLEPLGEDRWLRPGEKFRVQDDYDGEEAPFTVDFWADVADRAAGIEHVAVWIEYGDCHATVTDETGAVIACGHQRPTGVDHEWADARAA
ncbi:hypothetical protein Acy02nite_03230 [Actinoplanes cyaneus]|uniref:Uncharacterized protein n=2 Tax=Actinoplanes cyaneus TaxID=52696 RepID=A0A919IBI4_9ACTN|nr:hypothetical protein [Actinoplanes cyaneus]GID62442.1 hypothetical protein Acy02nite_03230 [Actinoplanes cyaneus]